MIYLSHVELSYTILKRNTAGCSLCYDFFTTIVYRLLVFILKTSKFYPSTSPCILQGCEDVLLNAIEIPIQHPID